MRTDAGNNKDVQAILDHALGGGLSEEQAKQLYRLGSEAVTFVLLALSQRLASSSGKHNEQSTPDPSTPSGQIPLYKKRDESKGKKKRPGARKGHPGSRRSVPSNVDRRLEHRLDQCPDCGGPLQKCSRTRTRMTEDIPEPIEPVVTLHIIHRDYCPKCKKDVEPVVADALPKSMFGHHVLCLTSWLHYGLGLTIGHITSVLSHHLHARLTPGGLIGMWQRLALILEPWYQRIAVQARDSACLHADETGWRVNGQTRWLWCFTNGKVCYYMIDRSRGSPALQKFFTDIFDGVLITDFWSAYDAVWADGRQMCMAHLLRELERVDEHNDSDEWQAFAKKLRRLIGDAIRLRHLPDYDPHHYAGRVRRIDARLCALADTPYEDKDATRLAKRLGKYRDYLWTFLDEPNVPYDNNFAERQLRPAVILRKNSQSNRSEKGAATQAILMSIYRTLQLRGLNPTQTIADALKAYIKTGTLPPLPDKLSADG
jgi:transposase